MYGIIISEERDFMANTTTVYADVDTNLKENAEAILYRLGISPSSAIQMLYSQIVLENGMPFTSKIPCIPPVSINEMTLEQINAELIKGINSIETERTYTVDEIDKQFEADFSE